MAYTDKIGTARRFVVRRGSLVSRVLAGLVALDGHYRQRRRLAEMSDAALRDIGLTPEDRQAARSRWDAPVVMHQHW